MNLERKLGFDTRSLDHPGEPCGAEGRAAL
jgi:hypothetical protein